MAGSGRFALLPCLRERYKIEMSKNKRSSKPAPVHGAAPAGNRPVAAVVLAAGLGTRMKSSLPKVLHPLAGRPIVAHVLDALSPLQPDRVVVVVGPGQDAVAAAVAPHPTVLQRQRLGTADAVKAARAELSGFTGDVLILCGDVPLIRSETLVATRDIRRADPSVAVTVLGFRVEDPTGYGRLIVDDEDDSQLLGIVEERDCDAEQRQIDLCNSGLIWADGRVLFDLLDEVGNDNAKAEFYLTDIVAVARGRGMPCSFVEVSEEETIGINSKSDLANAELLMQDRLREAAMAAGVTLIDPSTVYLSADTRFGRDVTVEPNVFFGPGVTVGDDATIHAFCHIAQAKIGSGTKVGPFARLRDGTVLGAKVRIGNFVETKNTVMGDGAKASHLSYVGDSEVGEKANIGAGTITCNYDGYAKNKTVIGAGAFIGSNTALVAPVTVGARALVAAGSTVTRDVPDDAMAVGRGQQAVKDGWAARYRSAQEAKKRQGQA